MRQVKVTFKQTRPVPSTFTPGTMVNQDFFEDRWVQADSVRQHKKYKLSGLSGIWEAYTVSREFRDSVS